MKFSLLLFVLAQKLKSAAKRNVAYKKHLGIMQNPLQDQRHIHLLLTRWGTSAFKRRQGQQILNQIAHAI